MVSLRWMLAGVLVMLLPDPVLYAADHSLAVGVMAAGNCKFRASSVSLDFGSLDPGRGRDVTASAVLTFRCTKGASWTVTDDGGLQNLPGGAYRMRHTALAVYLPYRLIYTNATGTSLSANVTETLTIDGLIRGADFIDANQGNYADTVTLTLNP